MTEPHLREIEKDLLRKYLSHWVPVMLEGPPGIGKSMAARYWGERIYAELGLVAGDAYWKRCADEQPPNGGAALSPDELRRRWAKPLTLEISEDTEAKDVVGEFDFAQYFADLQSKKDPAACLAQDPDHYFRKGRLYEAAEQGRLLIVEELDRAGRPSMFSLFFDALEYKRVRRPVMPRIAGSPPVPDELVALPGFNLVITANRTTDTGTVPFPEALLRRVRRLVLYHPAADLFDEPALATVTKTLAMDRIPGRALEAEYGILLASVGQLDELARETAKLPAAIDPYQHWRKGKGTLGNDRENLTPLYYVLARSAARLRREFRGEERISPAELVKLLWDALVCDEAVYGVLAAIATTQPDERAAVLDPKRAMLPRRVAARSLARIVARFAGAIGKFWDPLETLMTRVQAIVEEEAAYVSWSNEG